MTVRDFILTFNYDMEDCEICVVSPGGTNEICSGSFHKMLYPSGELFITARSNRIQELINAQDFLYDIAWILDFEIDHHSAFINKVWIKEDYADIPERNVCVIPSNRRYLYSFAISLKGIYSVQDLNYTIYRIERGRSHRDAIAEMRLDLHGETYRYDEEGGLYDSD